MTDLPARFADSLRQLLAAGGGGFPMGLAVSGGGDSVALLHLAVAAGLPVRVVTVDHGLRPEAAAEAAFVTEVCASVAVPHQVLHWHWDGKGNLQNAARRGRRAVMADWARGAGVSTIALGHTRDDVAETFVMRLARGAGVDGLSAMAGHWHEGGTLWLRPMLGLHRDALREYLRGLGAIWVEDPSNDNPRFDRVRVRKALAGLGDLGLTTDTLADVAQHLQQARVALDQAAGAAVQRVATLHGNAMRLDVAALTDQACEVQRRVLLRVIRQLAPGDYAPRGSAVQALLARVLQGRAAVLGGVRFQALRSGFWAYREARAVASTVCAAGGVWDGRWQIAGPVGAEIRALGTGIALCPAWRDTGVPRGALLASPALWLNGALIAAPHAGLGNHDSVISHIPAAATRQCDLSH